MNVISTLPLFVIAISVSLPAQTIPQSRIMTSIEESHLVTLRGNVHPLARAGFDRGPAAASTPTGRLLLLLQRSAAQEQALRQYLVDVQNPSSPNYRKWLTPAQYGAQFGVSDTDLQTIESWLQSHGFKIEKAAQGRNAIEFSGSFDQVERAFHTAIHVFQVNGENHFANVTDPQIPAALAPVVAGIGPLNSFHARPAFVAGPSGHWDPTAHRIEPDLTLQDTNGNFYLFVDPADAATIYDTPNRALNPNYSGGNTWDGTGVNLGIIGVSDLTVADVQNYREAFLGEAAGSVNLPTQVVDGNDPGMVAGSAADEALLDNEIAGGIAPNAKILYYTAADTDLSSGLLDAAFRAIDDNAVSILSASFSECESALGAAGNQLMLEAAEQAAAQGISFVVSTGDGGSAGCDDFDTQTQAQLGFAVNGLASTPYTVAVGGTDFDGLPAAFASYVDTSSSGTAPFYGTALSYIPENPWNDSTRVNTSLSNNVPYVDGQGRTNIIAGSGGVSSIYAKPSWQSSLTPTDNARDLPDVSFLAGTGFYNAAWVFCGDSTSDGSSGTSYTACQTSGGQFTAGSVFEGVGGTSAAAPAFAGMLALVSQSQGGARLGQPNPVLYGLAASQYATVFQDITTGNNSVPCATGSPNCGSNGFLTGYDAGTGYDLASGLGSLDVSKLVQNWTSVSLASTSTTLNIGGSTASYTGIHGASLTFSVGVTSIGTATPTGNVAIIDNANETSGGTSSGPQNDGQVTIPLTSGTATATYNGLPGGSYTVEARYGGDAANAASSSSPISVTITPESSTTVLSVNAYNPLTGAAVSGSNIPYGSIVVADARIEGAAEGSGTQGVATGTVTFSNGATALGSANVGAGSIASWPSVTGKPTIPPVASYSYSASYSGDASFNTSTSTTVPFTIVKASTALTINNAPSSVYDVYGLTGIYTGFQVAITTPYNLGAAPTGSVTVTINGQQADTISSLSWNLTTQNSGAAATWVITAPANIPDNLFQTGANAIAVAYSGDANYAGASAATTITDMDGIGTFTMAGSGDVTVTAGFTAHEAVTITPSGGFSDNVVISSSPLPSGFHIYNGLGGAPILNSQPYIDDVQIVTDWTMAPGTYPITLTAQDPTGKTVHSISFNVIVTGIPANAGLSLSNAGPVVISAGDTTDNATSVTLTPTNGFVGEVNFTCTVTTSLTNVVNPPTCQSNIFTWVTTSSAQTVSIPIITAKNTTPGGYTVTVTATDGLNSSIAASTAVPLTVNPYNGVLISIDPFSLSIGAGAISGNTLAMTLTPTGGFIGTVNLICNPVTSPAGAVSPVACVVPSPVVFSSASPIVTNLIANTTASTTPGSYTFGVNVYDSSSGVHYSGTMIAVVVQAGPGLTMAKSGDITVAPGASTGNTSTITVAPSNGFTGTANLSCSLANSPSGATDLPTCSIPASVNIIGTTAATATLTVSTTAPSSASLERPLTRFLFAGGGAVLAAVFFFGIPARRREWRALLVLLAVMVISSAMVGCGGGGGSGGAPGAGGAGTGGGGGGQTNPGTTPGSYTITVKAADGATGKITASTNVILTVN